MRRSGIARVVFVILALGAFSGCVSGTLRVHSPTPLGANPTEEDRLRYDCETRIEQTAEVNNSKRTFWGIAELLLGGVSTLSSGIGLIGNTQALHLGDVVTITTGALGTVTGLLTPVVAILGDTSQIQREHGVMSDELDQANIASDAARSAPPATTPPAAPAPGATPTPPAAAATTPTPSAGAARATAAGAGSLPRGGSMSAASISGLLGGGATHASDMPADPVSLLRRCARGHSSFHVDPIRPPESASGNGH